MKVSFEAVWFLWMAMPEGRLKDAFKGGCASLYPQAAAKSADALPATVCVSRKERSYFWMEMSL
jgi:hypothetical protein